MKTAVAPQVGKVIQSRTNYSLLPFEQRLTSSSALLRLSEETDLDVLNSCMEAMVEQYHQELLPVAAELTARLVRIEASRLLRATHT